VRPLVGFLFGGVKTGRVGRGDFAKGIGLAAIGAALTLVPFDWLVRFAEQFSDGGPPSLIGLPLQLVGFVLAALVLTLTSLLVFAFFNLIARRARDLGLPGWKAVAVATMLGTAFSLAAPLAATAVYVLAVWAVLLARPGIASAEGGQVVGEAEGELHDRQGRVGMPAAGEDGRA
jgi:uncharacterized membrane protein YhaH (DUF805 family)